MESVRLIAVPFYDSLSIRRNWQEIKHFYPDISSYFPDYDPEYMPSRKFFWEVFASLHYEDAKTIIDNERKRKYEKEANEKTKEIVISKDILNLIQGPLYYSKKKGRALYNINPKDYGKLPKRRRRLSELEGYQGDSHDISVFNKNRTSKRVKSSDNSPNDSANANISIRTRPFTDQDSFRKNNKQ